ncbi:hypothetical protein L7F22_055529 [Adiantum nelumboides]|nr:hypothetical protein [Adiantum nelumboides]
MSYEPNPFDEEDVNPFANSAGRPSGQPQYGGGAFFNPQHAGSLSQADRDVTINIPLGNGKDIAKKERELDAKEAELKRREQRRETSKEQRSNDAKDSNEQTMSQTIRMPMSNAGCFGGGLVFQAMIRPSPALHGFMPDNAYGAMQAGSSNPMYGNIGAQPGFQCGAGSYGMLGANMGMAGFAQLEAQNLNMAVSSFKMVPLAEQIEKYRCGLPKGIKKYCTKASVMNMAMLMENAEVADDLIQGKPDEDGFKTRRKEPRENNVQPRAISLQGLRFSKQAHFVPVRKKIKLEHMVKVFMYNIFKYHGMPQSVVSDIDPRMMSFFWKALFENMGTMLKFSSLFHPQTDGQSEEANSIVLYLLKYYVSEHKETWEHYLPLVEYAYNNIVHTSIGKAPFEIVEGGKKVPPILQTKDKIFEADKYVQNTDEAYRKIKLALEKTQSKQKKAADRHRRELSQMGDVSTHV